MADLVVQRAIPAPYPPDQRPSPSEIVCVHVDKVYDFCVEQDTGITNCVTLPPVIPASADVFAGVVDSVICTTGPPVATGVDAISSLMVTVTITYTLFLATPTGAVFSLTNTFDFTKTVLVCAPVGTFQECEASAVFFAPPPCHIVVSRFAVQVCCAFNICLIVESLAPVTSLLPSFGFCTPARCQTGGIPPEADRRP